MKTQKQLLQELAAIRKKKKRLIKAKEEKEKSVKSYKQKNKICFFNHEDHGWLGRNGTWQYNPIQKKFFLALEDTSKKIYTLTGGNRISKTFSTTGCVALLYMQGCWPWQNPDEVGRWFWKERGWINSDGTPQRISLRIVGQDWEKHVKQTLIRTIDEIWPEDWGIIRKKNSIGVDAIFTHPITGVTVEIMSNKSDSGVFEGWFGHGVIYDEPPRRDVRIACSRGLVDYNGLEFFAMTLLGGERWVEEEVINMTYPDYIDNDPDKGEHPKAGQPDECVWSINGETKDNIGFGIDEEGVAQFSKSLTPEERDARLRGIPLYKSGLILKVDKQKHIVEPRKWTNDFGELEIPKHWLFDIFIDYHPAKPHYVDYFAVDEHGYHYLVFSDVFNGTAGDIVDKIIRRVDKYQLRVDSVFADPLSKSDKNNIETVYDKVENGLASYGIPLYSAGGFKKSKDDGIIQINGWLDPKNGIPLFYFFRHCASAIKQCTDWFYDENKITKEMKPAKTKDDHPENLYRYALLNREYYDPEPEEIELPDNRRQSDYVTGY